MTIFSKAPIHIAVFAMILGIFGPAAVFAAGPAPISLLSADHFAILAKSGISTTGTTSVVGDLGVSPSAATSITGFALSLPAASAFATSARVTGKIYAPGYASPTPANMTSAIHDMETAYTDAMGRTNPTATELGAGNIGGMTLAPGLYKWSTGLSIPTDVTLSGSADDVWIFQIAQNLNISSAKKVVLSGGAQANHVFWAVAGKTTIGTTAVFNGNILDKTAIVLNTGATLHGRAFAQTAVTLDANAITIPVEEATVPTPVTEPVVIVTPEVTVTPSPVSVSTPEVTTTPSPAPVSVLIQNPTQTETLVNNLGVPRLMSEEAKWEPLIQSDAIAFKVGLTATESTAITNFVTYGASAETKSLGAGERRALVRDYFETVGRADVNWNDIQRMTTGQKPLVRNLPNEQANVAAALAVYVKFVGHAPNFSIPKEDLAWNTLMYRIRFPRDLNKERAGITKFQSLFKRVPSSPLDWSAVRAWAYAL